MSLIVKHKRGRKHQITTETSWFQMPFGIVIDNKVKIEVHIGSTCQKQIES